MDSGRYVQTCNLPFPSTDLRMARQRFRCFVIMPFKPGFRFLYLYIRDQLDTRLGIAVERGDDQVLSRSLLEKIKWQIARTDILIADITGGNPNVFYEIGFAHANAKPVLFLSGDSEASAPTDIRQFEVISYNSGDENRLIQKLENAIINELREEFSSEQRIASQLCDVFANTVASGCTAVLGEDFIRRLIRDVVDMPSPSNVGPYAEFLMRRFLDASGDPRLIREAVAWAGRLSVLPSL